MTTTPDVHPFDAPSAADLRARGGLKWTGTDADVAAWVAEADHGTAPAVTAALLGAVTAGVVGYLPPAVRHDLAEACAQWQRDRYGWEVDPRRVKPVADVLEALRITAAHYGRPGSPLIVPTPAYMPFLAAPTVWGHEVLQVPMAVTAEGRATLDLPAIEAAFEDGGHLLVLTNPHNPTGRVHTRAELLALAEVVERHGGRVFADEIHAPLVHAPATHVPYASLTAATAGHTVTATSASKAWNIPGLKCAQVILSSTADDERWIPADQYLTGGASTLGAIATTAAYREGGEWLADVLEHLAGNSEALVRTLAEHAPDVVHRPAEGTYLAWLDLRPALAARAARHGLPDTSSVPEDLGRWLRTSAGVAVVDGAACGEAGRGFVRLNLAMPRPLVVEAGRRIGACLDEG